MKSAESKQRFLHKAEISILKSLRRMEHARFSELMHPTGLTSDNFKFYLRDLVKLGWIRKTDAGTYVLTVEGKELANNLDETRQTIQKQPKLSVLVVVSRDRMDGETEYLLQQRLRHPYYGFWGVLSGPVQWGDSFEETARAELHKQTGLTARFEVLSFLREYDFDKGETLLEDKLFVVLRAHDLQGSIDTPWGGGVNRWMTLAELAQQPKRFPLTEDTIRMADNGPLYGSFRHHYSAGEY